MGTSQNYVFDVWVWVKPRTLPFCFSQKIKKGSFFRDTII